MEQKRYLTFALGKGRLAKKTLELFEKIGITCDEIRDPDTRKLIFVNEELGLRFFLAKGPDVPTYVEYGAADIGIVGKDTILEESRNIYEVLDLGFGKCKMCICGPESAAELLQRHEQIRVATKYPRIAKDYFYNKKHQTVEIIKLNGSIELAPIVGLSEVICDIVETGTTLRENGLTVLEEVCPLSARVVVNQVSMKMENERITKLINDIKNYGVRVKELNVNGIPYKVQFNPARIVSSGAKVDAKSIQERKCFLCPANLPPVQKGIPFGGHYHILVNPFPIFPRHLTIPELAHTPQRIASRFTDMLELAEALTEYTIFYNGPRCGASAPDHAHFQAGNKGFMPIEKDWRGQTAGKIADYRKAALWYLDDAPRATLVIESTSKEDAADLFDIIYRSLDVKPEEDEPMMNVLVLYEADRWVVFVFPREKHRPACYTAEGEANLLSSPASVDLGGVFITPVEKDFLKITAEDVAQILSEVCLSATDFHKVRQRIREKI